MRALSATLRLLWRPLTLLKLGALGVVVALLLQVIPDESRVIPVLRALWLGTATPAMVTALWLVLAIAPAGIGLIVATGRMELQHTTLAWHLPDARRRLLTGSVVCALTVALALAALMWRNASAAATVAAFSIACWSFLVPGFVLDAVVPRPARVLMALPFVGVVGWPGSTARLSHQHPLLVTTLGLVLAALQLAAMASRRLARPRPFRRAAFPQSSRLPIRVGRDARRPAWEQRLATEGLVAWLFAAMYESKTRYPLAHLGNAAIAVVVARLLDMPQVIPIFAGSFLMKTGLQLRMAVAYPLSRRRRARLAYAGSVVDALTCFLFLGVLLYSTSLARVPRLPFVDGEPSRAIEWVVMWASSLALVPIAQLRRIRHPDEDPGRLSDTRVFGFVAQLLVYAFVVMLAGAQIQASTTDAGDLGRALIAAGIIALVAQVTHAALVYAYYTRNDLVRADRATTN